MTKQAENPTRTELHFPEFPSYLTAYLIRQENSFKVEVHSMIHVNKIVTMPHTWTLDFPWTRLRGDVFGFIIQRYGLTKEPERWS